MSSLLIIFVIALTAASVVALGILLAYVLITAILHSFGRRTTAPEPSAALLIPSQTHASGD